MLSCFNSVALITQKFANDFWVDMENKYSIDDIDKIMHSGYDIQAISSNKSIILYGKIKIYIKLYYKSMGIDGHDGLDLVPFDKKDLSIFNLWEGILMIKQLHPIYGNRIAIWNPETNLTEYHNHMEKFLINANIGDKIKSRTLLGIMGKTGAVFGAHNHFAIAKTDSQGNRINRDNGYFGYVDPLPYLFKE
jgi:hypothetical protein